MLNKKIVDFVARRFQVLGEPCRLRILDALHGGPMTVAQIVNHVDGSQPNISKHLQILFDAGLVSRERSRNNMLYGVADPVVFRLCELVCRSTARRAAALGKYAMAPSRVAASHRRLKRDPERGVH
jgi:DNA-binding transcriptional ArsR family regulator